LCDRQSSTKVNFATKSSKGDNVLLKYDKVFQCQGISLRINGPEDFSALLQTSADGIIFSTIKILKPGANDISLKNEKVQAVRVVVYNDTEKPWSLGDISCR
jgi:limonene-1,2-epoxide hydrolase